MLQLGGKLFHMVDVKNPSTVDIRVSDDGKVWVNVDGVCALRVYGAGEVEVKLPATSPDAPGPLQLTY